MKRIANKAAFFAIAAMMVGSSGIMMTHAQAADLPMNELEGGSSAALAFGTGADTTFTINAGYSRTLNDMFQGSLVAGFDIISLPVGSAKALVVKIGPTFNLALDNNGIKGAIYVRLLAGIAYSTDSSSGTSVSSTNFAYEGQIGKRFELWSNVFWKPAFDISGTTMSGANPLYAFIPAQFSFLF